jgi:hypothetical protein
MALKLKNNAAGVLAASISASDTGITLAAGQGATFPTMTAGDYFYATLENTDGSYEIVKVTARSGDGMTIVRGQEDTATNGFAQGARFAMRVTVQNILDVIGSNEDYGSIV